MAELTSKQRAFLSWYGEHAWGMPTSRACKIFGLARQSWHRWKKEDRFASALAEIEAAFPPAPYVEYDENLERWLRAYEKTRDREKASSRSGVGPGWLEQALKLCPPFLKAFEYVRKGTLLTSEDLLEQAALDGKDEAIKMVLKARHPDYAQKLKVVGRVEHDHVHRVTPELRAARRQELLGQIGVHDAEYEELAS